MANSVKVTDNSDMFLNAADAAVQKALEAVGLQAESYAALYCLVDTGRLRGSITHATATSHDKGNPPAKAKDFELQGSPKHGEVYIGTNVEYAPFVELNHKAFLRPAMENHLEEYKRIIKAALQGN